MKKLISLIAFLVLPLFAFSQGEANIWYFGQNAGLDFNSGSPVALTNGQLNTQEGCATLSNSAGQLLFYTDGITVYNKNHVIMANGNGLMGHPSTTQSATIVPKPGSPNLFYIFTIDVEGGVNGFRYSIVDLSLGGGLGAVTSDKNVLVYAPTCEKIAIVKHANNVDFWVITHGFNNNSFYANTLSQFGLNSIPVVSNVGVLVNNISGTRAMGYMKVSPDGTKLVACHQFMDVAQLFDFNNVTGILTNPIDLLNESTQIYGAEFSPNSEVLYIGTATNKKIHQFNLNAPNIPASKILITTFTNNLAALQLGPDSKIYIAHGGISKLSCINNPNVLGLGCDLQIKNIDLSGRLCLLGLPAFNQSFFFSPAIQFDNACVGQNANITFNTNQTVLSALWDFGDGSPTQNNIAGNHVYTSAGTYPVSVTVNTPAGSGTSIRNITISAVPTATQPQNILICDADNNGLYNFNLTTQNSTILNAQSASDYTIKYYANATDYANNLAIANPSNYQNTTAYQQQTIIAEVTNNANLDCKANTTFNIDVFDMPLPNLPANIPNLTVCDNTTVGTDTDGRLLFNLTQRATAILNGQSATQFTISYYRNSALTSQIITPASYQNTNPTETIYVKVVNNDNANCTATTSFTIQVFALPVITTLVDLKQCDDNIDGFSVFNLTEANSKISTNFNTETFAYFETFTEAQNNTNPILNFTTYTNQIVSNDVVYVRITNTNGCFRTAQLNLSVSTTQIPLSYTRSFTQCDDVAFGTNTDGISSFDFSSVTSQIQAIFPIGQQLIITYYRNLADALAENNAITNIANYRNIGYPNTQNIYIRVDSQTNNDCLGLGNHITLNVERIPIVSSVTYTECDDDQDGQFPFNTAQIQTNLLNGLTNVTVNYFDQNNISLSSPLPNPFLTASQLVKVVVTNNTATGCDFETTIKFVVDDLPEAFPIPLNLIQVCDDELVPTLQDGKFSFDTTTFQNTILGSQTGMIVTYFDGNNVPLSSPLHNPFVTASQNITVKITNPINPTCNDTAILPFVVKPLPNIILLDDEIVCNEKTLNKTINAGLVDETTNSNFTYVWKRDGVIIPSQNNYSLSINEEGVYTVIVTNAQGCSRTRTITVIASDKATIENIKVIDLSENNTIVISVTGAGMYEYSLDNQTYQSSNTFTNLPAGIYTVYVKDLNGCGVTQEEVSVLGIPSFFTPNADGFNDYWNVKGISSTLNSKTIIYIFDRFGKLIKEINPITTGWDGSYNNQPLPATDYWYSIELEDGRNVKGHFALKR